MALVERRALGRGMAVIAPERPRSGPLVANVRERDAQARMDAMAAELAALKAELARHEERTEGLSAEQTQKRAVAWREAHPEAWRRIRADGARAAADRRVPRQSGQTSSFRNFSTRFMPFSSLTFARAFSTV